MNIEGFYTTLLKKLGEENVPPMNERQCMIILNHLRKFDAMVEYGVLELYTAKVTWKNCIGDPILTISLKALALPKAPIILDITP